MFTSIALKRYWIFLETVTVDDENAYESLSLDLSQNETAVSCHKHDVLFIKVYLIGVNAIVALNLPLSLLMILNSAQGSIVDSNARKLVSPLLYLK